MSLIIDEKRPQLSPLYKEIPNASVDEFGTITMLPYWRVAKKRQYSENEIYCETCGKITEHKDRNCGVCGTKFTFNPVRGVVK